MTAPAQRKPWSARTREFLESGEDKEEQVRRDLRREGWKVVEEQARFEIRDSQCRIILSGKIDGKLVWEIENERPLLIPIEVKDVERWRMESVESVDDLRWSPWTRKWVRQLNAYVFESGAPFGILILACSGQRAWIIVPLDEDLARETLRRCEKAVDGIEALTGMPVEDLDQALTDIGMPHLGKLSQCRSCDWFERACFPPVEHPLEGELLDIPELEDVVARVHEIAPIGREYASLSRRLEAWKGKFVQAGDYLLAGHWEEQRGDRKVWRREIIAPNREHPEILATEIVEGETDEPELLAVEVKA